MKTCGRCGKENPDEQTNCSRCGISLQVSNDFSGQQAQPEHYCHWHPKTPTNLACGKCERYICTKCAILTSAGPRCKECAKQNVAFRPAAVVHQAKVGASSVFRAGPYTWWIAIALIGALGTLVRTCATPREPTLPREQIERAPVEPSGTVDEGRRT